LKTPGDKGANSPANCTISAESTNDTRDSDSQAPTSIDQPKSKLQKKNQWRKERKKKQKREEASKKQLENDEKEKKGSLLWTVEMLRADDEKALKILRRWTNRQRSSEVNIDLLSQLRQLAPTQQKEVLRELKRPKTWIRRINQNSVLTPITIGTLDDQRTFHLNSTPFLDLFQSIMQMAHITKGALFDL
jgi:hypothetical protein